MEHKLPSRSKGHNLTVNNDHMEEITITMKQSDDKMITDEKEFAMALKTWRLRQGLTQQQVGERWGLSRYTIIRAEKCKGLTWESIYKLFNRLAEELRKEGSV